MEVTERQRRLLALCAIRADGAGVARTVDWSLIARQAQFEEGLDALWAGRIFETSAAAKRSAPVLRRGIEGAETARRAGSRQRLRPPNGPGAGLVTVLDEALPGQPAADPQPAALPVLPGRLWPRTTRRRWPWSARARASGAGIERAARLSELLAGHRRHGHLRAWPGASTPPPTRAALGSGGRTIAVLGTGITRCYPPREPGSCRSRSHRPVPWCRSSGRRETPGRDTFPRRMSLHPASARAPLSSKRAKLLEPRCKRGLALEHDKKVFLVASLVADQPWARDYVDPPGTRSRSATLTRCSGTWPPRTGIRQKARQQQQLSLTLL